jgi:enolase
MKAIEKAGYKPGEEIALALDCAATEFFKDGKYVLGAAGKPGAQRRQMVAYLQGSGRAYPIVSIEDGISEDDWDGWKALTEEIGDKVQLVGLQLDVGIDLVVGEHAASLQELAVGIQAFQRFTQLPHTVGMSFSSSGGRS